MVSVGILKTWKVVFFLIKIIEMTLVKKSNRFPMYNSIIYHYGFCAVCSLAKWKVFIEIPLDL